MNKSSFNPLSVTDSDVSPNMHLMTKVIVIGLYLKGYFYGLSDHFLPLIPIFDHFGPPAVFEKTLQAFFLISSAGVLFNVRVRLSCIVLGLVLLVTTVSSLVSYRNSVVFCGLMFLMTGLHKKGETPWLVHYQIALLYFGAGLNKMLDADWRSGQFFHNWMHSIIHGKVYLAAEAWFPPMVLAKIMGWSSFIVELTACVGLLTRRFRPIIISMLVLFHTGAMVMTSGDFGIFTIAILASYLSFIEWPPNEQMASMTLKQRILYSTLFYVGVAVFLALAADRYRSIVAALLILALYPYSKIKSWILPERN